MRPGFLSGVAAFWVALAVAPREARAQNDLGFPDRGHTVIVLDNLGGFVRSEVNYPGSTNQGGSTNTGGVFPFTPVARFGIHQFVAGGLSLGAGLIYADESQSLFNGSPAGTTFGIAPRIGYGFALSPTLALWIRGGITYLNTSMSGGGQLWQFSPGGEVFLVITPVSHFGITLGPYGEFAVAGKECQNNGVAAGGGPPPACQSQDIRENYYGITAGILADF